MKKLLVVGLLVMGIVVQGNDTNDKGVNLLDELLPDYSFLRKGCQTKNDDEYDRWACNWLDNVVKRLPEWAAINHKFMQKEITSVSQLQIMAELIEHERQLHGLVDYKNCEDLVGVLLNGYPRVIAKKENELFVSKCRERVGMLQKELAQKDVAQQEMLKQELEQILSSK
jgi:hypothetical protein